VAEDGGMAGPARAAAAEDGEISRTGGGNGADEQARAAGGAADVGETAGASEASVADGATEVVEIHQEEEKEVYS